MLCRPHNIALVDLEARAVVACLRLLQQAKEPECAHTRRPRHLHRLSDGYTKTTSASAASPGFLYSTPAELMAKKQGVPTIELEVSSRAAAAAATATSTSTGLRRRRRHHRHGGAVVTTTSTPSTRACGGADADDLYAWYILCVCARTCARVWVCVC
ncbi:uncharacterized protein LOC125532579 isoform X2 [Triticum urartu]|uniref:uncharacterized protein LOC125532579 isoform X2 n=1 Tax=Triticum urartu TaxID=4572 RepID=UPI0020436F13|nr:uncharacterized protein LOC125532579 isoform X2 [Triticum urartu]